MLLALVLSGAVGAWAACDASDVLSGLRSPNHGLVEEAGDSGCAPGMARIGREGEQAFCMDRFEASLAEVLPDGSLSEWSPFHHPGVRRMRALSRKAAVPQGYIDGVTAGRACAEAGKRLCTDSEWLRACRGPEGRTYPYSTGPGPGDARRPGVCNDARAKHPAVELFPHAPNPFALIQNACINQLHDTVNRTGERAGCVTPEGVHDLMGNEHEWTADPAGTFRGGYYVDTRINGNGCLYRTTAHDTRHWDYSTGFRCCAGLRAGPDAK